MAEALRHGGIYLARLNPAKSAEVGKIRPIVVLTNNTFLAFAPVVFICPLSTQSHLTLHSLHPEIPAREHLLKTSVALVEHCRAISRSRILLPRLAQLTEAELMQIKARLNTIIA